MRPTCNPSECMTAFFEHDINGDYSWNTMKRPNHVIPEPLCETQLLVYNKKPMRFQRRSHGTWQGV